jgi:hypothetical protein
MSVSSILAFVLAGVAAKSRAPSDVGDKGDPRFIAGYEAGLNDGKLEAKAKIAELEEDIAIANAQARRDQDLIDAWRERALAIIPPEPWRGQQSAAAALQQYAALQRAQLQSQSLAQYSQQAQCNAQQAMNAQTFYAQAQYGQAQLGQGLPAMGLLGAQNLIDAELWCNCVPSRSQVWATSDPE